jgi:alkylation response protein AidB-like acyl-CoA dehydrogenase
MSYRLTEEERAIQRTVRELAEKELAPLVPDAERAGRFPREIVLPRLAELGLLSVGVPESLGGGGGGALVACVIGEEIARVSGGFAIGAMPSILAPGALYRLQGDRASESFLAPLMSGQLMPALAFTEPGGGSDLVAMRTIAERTDGGALLTGTKTFISNAPSADVFLVAAIRADHASKPRSERSRGIGVHVVLKDTAGVTVGPPFAKLGMRSSETSEVSFERAFAPSAGLGGGSGSEGRGFRQMMELLDINRLYISALSLGIAQAAFEASLEYARQRTAFDKPIAEHQATGFKLARMSMALDAGRALLQESAALYDAGKRCAREVSETKLFCTEAAVSITADAVQVHGAYGYVEDLPVERYFRDARVGTIWEGSSEIQQQIICRELGIGSASA